MARAFSPRSRESTPSHRRADGLTTEEYVSELINRRLRIGRSVHVRNPYEQSGVVYRAVLAVAGALADAPLEPWIGGDRKTGKLVETGQLPLLLKKPNRLMTQRDFKFAVAAQAMLFRRSDVLVKEGRVTGKPAELIPLPPGSIKPMRPRSDPFELIGWRFSYFGHFEELRPEQVMRFRYALDPIDPGLGGVHPFLPVEDVIDTDYAATLYNKSALERGGSFGGIVQMQPTPGEEVEELDDDTAAEIRRRLNDALAGPENAERIAVLTANMKWIPTGKAARDMQFTQAKALNVKDISRAPGIPPIFMNEYEGVGLGHDGLAVQYQMLYHNAVFPFATGMAEEMTEKVGHRFDERISIIFNYENVAALKEDARAKLERGKMLKELDFSRNEINDMLDIGGENTPEGDVVLVPAGMIPKKLAAEGGGLFGVGDEHEEPEENAPAKAAPEPATAPPVPLEVSSAIMKVVADVVAELVPRDSALAALTGLYGLAPERAEEILGSAGLEPPEPNPQAPPQLPTPPPSDPETAGAVSHLVRDARERRRARMWRQYNNQVKPYERRILREIRANLEDQLSDVEKAIASRGSEPGQTRDAKQDATAAAREFDPEALAEAIRAEILKTHTAGAKAVGKQLLDLGLVTDAVLEAEGDRLPELSERYFDARKGRIVDSGDVIRARLRESLFEGYQNGENLSDLKDRVRQLIEDVKLGQARTIARTEAHTGANNGRMVLMKRQGVAKHEWLSSRDSHVRPSHQIDGERRAVGELFSNGMEFPGDPKAPAEECINDRCSTVPVAEEFEAFEEATAQAAALDMDDLWSRNLARRALHLRVVAPCDAIARRIPALLAEAERRSGGAEGVEALRARMPQLVANPSIAGAVERLGGKVFASIWLDSWRNAA